MVEIVPLPDGGAQLRLFALDGHEREGWTETSRSEVHLEPVEFDRFGAELQQAFAGYREPVANPDNGETIICMDGPGYLTERVEAGRVTTLAGSCPPLRGVEHANVGIACRVRKLLQRHLAKGDRPYLVSAKRCRKL